MLRWYAMCKVKCADERYGDLSVHILKCESAPYSGMFLQSPKWGMHVMAICPCTINCEERTLWYGVSSCTLKCENARYIRRSVHKLMWRCTLRMVDKCTVQYVRCTLRWCEYVLLKAGYTRLVAFLYFM